MVDIPAGNCFKTPPANFTTQEISETFSVGK